MQRTLFCAALLVGAVAARVGGSGPRPSGDPPGSGRGMSGVAAAAEPPARSPRNANYAIEARLDVSRRILAGTETITWRNITSHATSELRLHLYHNAWANDRTSYARANRLGPLPWSLLLMDHREDDWGYCDITALTLLADAGAPGLSPLTSFIQPDDGNPDDRTVLRVALPAPVEPGGSVRLRVSWTEKIPRPFQRAGTKGDYFLLGQWFPKLGVLAPDGTWNCHQFIQTEFFSDFGVYRRGRHRAARMGRRGDRTPRHRDRSP